MVGYVSDIIKRSKVKNRMIDWSRHLRIMQGWIFVLNLYFNSELSALKLMLKS